MATTTIHSVGKWDTFHNNGPFDTKMLYKTHPEGKGNMPSWLDRYNDVAKEIQRLLQLASDNNEGFRAYGSAWSMSHIAHHKDNMHYNGLMNLKKAIQDDEMHSSSSYKRENLFYFQCGNLIKEISNFTFEHGKSIKSSGASNGQTIAGCISTGVHGSGLDSGSVQDYVVGINIITGPAAGDNVYIERKSRPALNDNFPKSINAIIIRDDELFNAAVVGLGAFGFIHGVLIEAEDRFLLNRYVRRIEKEKALELARTMDFENAPFNISGETDTGGKPSRPYHFKIFMNPYVQDTHYVVEAIYKAPYKDDYQDPIPIIKTAIYRDLIILFTKIAETCKNSIPKIIKLLHKSILPPVDKDTTGTLAETFWDAPYQGPAYACAVGIHHKDSPKALELLSKLTINEGPIPGIFALRFVKQSEATLAFTRFPVTCMLEIDGLIWKPKNNKMISLEKYCTRIIEVLKENNIGFTLHWGKNADWSFPGLVQHMYGNDMLKWKAQRSSLLTPANQSLFSNKFLMDTGLA